MSEIDVSKCRFSNDLGICASPINTNDIQCAVVPVDLCYFKQLQIKKQELSKISAEYSDTLSIVEDMAILLNLDKKDHFSIYQCYYKLKDLVKALKENAHYLACMTEQRNRYKQALDEIEKFIKSDMCKPCEESKDDPLEECNYKIILDTVNKAKGE